MKKKQDQEQSRRYSWVPAGMEYFKRGGPEIYVRYGKFPNRIVLKERTSSHMWIQCPDRELVIVSNGQHVDSFRPMQGTFDQLITLSPFHEPSASDLDYDYIMVNYTEYINKEHMASKIRQHGHDPNAKMRIIADSGGFQIWRGVVDYIDPVPLAQWYSENVDYAMILDIPTDVRGVKHFERLGKIQARNTQTIIDNKRADLELFNVFHGASPEEVAAFRALVERDDIDRLAIGGGYWGTVLGSINRWHGIVNEGRRYKHYHILGVQNVLQTLPIMRMVARDPELYITSDSTTHIQNAVSKNYYFHPHMSDKPRYLNIGYRGSKGGYIPSALMTLPCTCPVCATIKYKDVLAALSGHPIDTMMIYHNLFATQKYLRAMYEIVQQTTTKELKELVKYQFTAEGKKSRKSSVEEMLQAFDFIDCAADHGLEEARKKFEFFLPKQGKIDNGKSLFSKGQVVVNGDTPESDPLFKKMDAYAVKYELNQGAHGKKIIKKGESSAIQTVSAVARPGKRKKVKTSKKKSKQAKAKS